MAKTVVVYHSGYGHTQRIAQHVAQGANAQLVAINADGAITDAEWTALNEADAIIFGSPTYMGVVSWQFKKFADATSKQWMAGSWRDKVAGGFTISSNLSGDKLSTLQYFVTLAMQQGMVWVGQTESNGGNIVDGKNRLGSSTGLMAQCGGMDPADKIPQADLDTAVAYGQRVAAKAAKLRG